MAVMALVSGEAGVGVRWVCVRRGEWPLVAEKSWRLAEVDIGGLSGELGVCENVVLGMTRREAADDVARMLDRDGSVAVGRCCECTVELYDVGGCNSRCARDDGELAAEEMLLAGIEELTDCCTMSSVGWCA